MPTEILPFTTEAEWLQANSEEIKKRIERHVVRVPETGCWLWVGCLTEDGYGRMMIRPSGTKQTPARAHRVAYSVHKRPLAQQEVVRHDCDTPCCVNPDHLSVGSQQDNLADMRARNRERGVGVYNRLKTHCNSGHPLFGENVRIEGAAQARRCKTCENAKKGRLK